MADKKAQIEIGLEGADQVKENANKVKSSFDGIGNSLVGLAKKTTEVTNAILGIKPPDLVDATEKTRQWELTITRAALSVGLSADKLKEKFDKINLGYKSEELVSAFSEISKATGDPKGALEDLGEATKYAANTGKQSLSEVIPTVIALRKELNVPAGKLGDSLAYIKKAADDAKVPLQTVESQLIENSHAFSKFEVSTEAGRRRLIDLQVAANKGLNPTQASSAVSGILGAFSGNAQNIGKYLGHSIFNDKGEINLSATEEVKNRVSQTRDNEARLRVYTNLFGGDRRTALLFDKLNFRGLGANLSPAPAIKDEFLETPAGKIQTAAEIQEKNNREGGLFKPLVKLSRGVETSRAESIVDEEKKGDRTTLKVEQGIHILGQLADKVGTSTIAGKALNVLDAAVGFGYNTYRYEEQYNKERNEEYYGPGGGREKFLKESIAHPYGGLDVEAAKEELKALQQQTDLLKKLVENTNPTSGVQNQEVTRRPSTGAQ